MQRTTRRFPDNNENMKSGKAFRAITMICWKLSIHSSTRKADILTGEKVSRYEETDWLSGALRCLKKDEAVQALAEVNGTPRWLPTPRLRERIRETRRSLGIVIKKGFRDLGIGTEITCAHLEGQA